MARVCFICEKEIEKGYKVKDSFLLGIIRKIKQKLNILKNNELYVCENCLEAYKKRRASFERNNKINLVILILMVFTMFLLPLINGIELNLESIIANLVLISIIAVIFILLSVFVYIPEIEKEIHPPQQPGPDFQTQQQTAQPPAQTNAIVPLINQPNAIQPLALNQKATEIEREIKTEIETAKRRKKIKRISQKARKRSFKQRKKKPHKKARNIKKTAKKQKKKNR